VVRSLRDRLRKRFNVSVAETGMQDVRDRAVLTIALVATDGRMAESVLDRADQLVESQGDALIVSVQRDRY
jgi:uncharacterized protein